MVEIPFVEGPIDPKLLEGAVISHYVGDARELVTVGEDSILWTDGEEPVPTPRGEGAIVRLKPRRDATDAQVERVRAGFERLGVAAVRVMPRAGAATVFARLEVVEAVETPRQAALALAEVAPSRDRAALLRAVEAALDAAGL